MSIEKFAAAARAHAVFTENGDSILANKAYNDVSVARDEMRSSPDHGVASLKYLLNDSDAGVRLWASYYLLPVDPILARGALYDLSSESGLVAFSAKMTLREWDAGHLKIE